MNAEESDGVTNRSSDDLADDIVGIEQYQFSDPSKKEFLPWHRPRKQFVRHEQWMYFINQLVKDIGAVETLTYFGLPGDDLLDVRFFGKAICEPRSLKLRFLGFNNSANPQNDQQVELSISLDEISKSASYDPRSEIIPDDFRALVNDDSIAWQRTFEHGPYDVINLDLCDGFGSQPTGPFNETYYNALSRLLTVQIRRKSPWLLLLTTRVGKGHVNEDVLERLVALYRSNLTDCALFRTASDQAFKIADEAVLAKERHKPRGVQLVFLVGICKWLLKISAGQTPPSKMEVKSLLGYRVSPWASVEDMVSIAIRFDPTHGPLDDPTKLASMPALEVDECEGAAKALKKVSGLLDVDEMLSSQEDVRQEMVQETRMLLEAARYDTSTYAEWLGKKT